MTTPRQVVPAGFKVVRVYRRSRRVIDVAVNTIAGPASKLPHDGAAAGPLCQVCLVQ